MVFRLVSKLQISHLPALKKNNENYDAVLNCHKTAATGLADLLIHTFHDIHGQHRQLLDILLAPAIWSEQMALPIERELTR